MPSILIADDNEDLRKVLAWLLQPRALRAGMVAYMEKPLSALIIEATIRRFILAEK
jgi:DNA-binding NtrC family response regulator